MSRLFKILLLSLPLLATARAAGQEPRSVTAIELRSLSPEQADENLPYRLRGTFIYKDHDNAVFLQDETAGALFWYKGESRLIPGDLVEVQGTTRSGLYVPGLDKVTFRVIGRGRMPVPIEATYDDLISGRFHYQWVSVEGIVRSGRVNERGKSTIRLAMGSRIVEVHLMDFPSSVELLDHKIRVTGMAAGGINDRHQLNQPYVWPHDKDGIEILEKPLPAEELEAIPADTLLTFRPTARTGHRSRVGGTVLAAYADGRVFLRQDGTALAVKLTEPQPLMPGEFIEVLGFPEMEAFSAALVDAVVSSRSPGSPPAATSATVGTITSGKLNHDLVTLEGTVVDSFRTGKGGSILLQTNGPTLRADTPPMESLPAAGSRIRVRGICDVESFTPVDYVSRPVAISVLAASPADITVLDAPPWWTTGRLATALVTLGGIFSVAILWIILLKRQVEKQTAALRERIEKEAMMVERQRIAREFHDTLEQDLAGLSLHLGAASARNPGNTATSPLATACHLVTRIQTETRNLLLDLRAPANQVPDLPTALDLLARKYAGFTSPRVEVHSTTATVPLSPRAIHHLRMIATESVVNAVKHAGATLVTLDLRQTPEDLVLAVTDNGSGFEVTTEIRERHGHFGCMGIRERALKLGAEVAWLSSPGQGTTVRLILPVVNNPSLQPQC